MSTDKQQWERLNKLSREVEELKQRLATYLHEPPPPPTMQARLSAAAALLDFGMPEALVRSVLVGGITVGSLWLISRFFESDVLFGLGILSLSIGPTMLLAAVAASAYGQLRQLLPAPAPAPEAIAAD